MTYNKPQVLNVKSASVAIMGGLKHPDTNDSENNGSTNSSYRSDE